MYPFVMETPPDFGFGEIPQYNRDQRVRETVGELPAEVLHGGYVPLWVVVPGTDNKAIGARGNYRSTLQIPERSYLLGTRTYSSQASMFVLSMYENTSGRYISDKPVLSKLFGGSPNGIVASNAFTARVAFSYLKSPFIVLSSGQVTVELTNLSTSAATIQVMLLFAVPRGYGGVLGQVAELTQRVLGDNPLKASGANSGVGLVNPPWVTPPDGFKGFDYAQAIATPAFGAGDTTILTFTVPLGMDGVIKRIGNAYAGPGFVDGSGNLIWRILVDGRAVQGYDNILVQLGTINQPTTIDGVQVSSGQVVSLVVNNATAVLPVAGTQVTGRLGGYFYPLI